MTLDCTDPLDLILQKKEEFINMKNKDAKDKPNNKNEEKPIKSEKVPKQVIQISIGGILGILLPTFCTIIGAAVTVTWIVGNRFEELSTKIGTVEDQVNEMSTDIAELRTDVDDIHDYLYLNNGVADQLENINKMLNIKVVNIPNSNEYSSIISEIRHNDIYFSGKESEIKSLTKIGIDADGNEYIAKDLINETVLLTYKENDKEIYFLGQYNENYHWNGYCVTNAYFLDGSLYGICESNFEDGKRLDYKSIYLSDNGQWIFSDRICNDGSNSGTSIHYTLNYDKIKNFTSTNVRVNDIIYTDKFIDSVSPVIKSFYSGDTSQEYYNDNSGNAYEIIYNDDGTVKTLYVGCFANGTFNDDTGNAWDIAYAEKYGSYVYNTGNFKNGNAVNKSTEPISIEEIQKIVSKYNFDSELKWKN